MCFSQTEVKEKKDALNHLDQYASYLITEMYFLRTLFLDEE